VDQLIQVVEVGLKYQNQMIAVEMDRLRAQQEAIAELERVVGGFRG
jgi:RecB family endonuclease NucS